MFRLLSVAPLLGTLVEAEPLGEKAVEKLPAEITCDVLYYMLRSNTSVNSILY